MFLITVLKILGRGTLIFFYLLYFFLGGRGGGVGNNIILCILKGISPFKMHKIIFFFPENLKEFYISPVNLGKVGLL